MKSTEVKMAVVVVVFMHRVGCNVLVCSYGDDDDDGGGLVWVVCITRDGISIIYSGIPSTIYKIQRHTYMEGVFDYLKHPSQLLKNNNHDKNCCFW